MTKITICFVIGMLTGAALKPAPAPPPTPKPTSVERMDFQFECQRIGGSPYACMQEWDRLHPVK